MSMPQSAFPAERIYLDAVLHPHRSLGRGTFHVFMLLLAGLSVAISGFFYLRGAWPVIGFFGLDLFAIWLALRLNNRTGRLYETVRLTDTALHIARVEPRGRTRRFKLEPYWVRVNIEREGSTERLVVASHGRKLMIGPFLNNEERADFAQALKQALHRWRNAGVPEST